MPVIDEEFIAQLRSRLGERDAAAPSQARGAERAQAGSCTYVHPEHGQPDAEREALRRIVRLCNVSERSTKALSERLAKDGFEPEVAERALARAEELGIVDDRRYAEALVRSRLGAGKGRAGIAREVASLGIDPETLDSWEEGEDDELERALELLRKRPPRAKNLRAAAYRRLVTKGYSSSCAQTAARLWSESAETGEIV